MSTGDLFVKSPKGTVQMIVIGTDTHKAWHTAGATDAVTGQVIADKTVAAKRYGFEDLLLWARGLGRRACLGD